MKIVYINTFNHGSTGRVCTTLGKFMEEKGHECFYFYGREEDNSVPNWSYLGEGKAKLALSNGLVYALGKVGSFHKGNTKKLVARLKEIDPDIIHLHNLHGNYVNFDILFDYLKTSRAKIIMTLHDEFWATGRCAYIPAGCDRRSHQCDKCKFLADYPRELIDTAHKLFVKKMGYLNSLKNVTYISPSKWLQNSFLSSDIGKGKHCIVINNGFDLSGIKPKILERENNKIKLLAAAFEWNELKGRHILEKLCDLLDFSKYDLTVVGGIQDNYKFPAKINYFPKMSKEKLAEFYANADVFLMPTFNDNFPTVLIESLSYGLPIISFDSGGCKEIVLPCGEMVEDKTAEGLLKAIESFDLNKYPKEKCKEHAKDFSVQKFLDSYYNEYMKK